jgi:short-subunit dehydrogenase
MYVITGASSGLGHEVTKQLLKKVSRSKKEPETVIGICTRQPDFTDTSFLWIPFDQSNWKSTEVVVSKILKYKEKLQGIVHCAGILSLEGFGRLTEKEASHVLAVNVTGLAHLHGLLLDRVKVDHTSTVIVTSTSVLQPKARQPIYAASHWARQCLAKTFRDELADFVDTPTHTIAPDAMQPSGMASPKPGKRYINNKYVAERIISLLSSDGVTEEDIVLNRRKAGSIE